MYKLLFVLFFFSQTSFSKQLDIQGLPLAGKTVAGQAITLGGFSGLQYIGKSKAGNYRFISLTDRGPNSPGQGDRRPFLLPSYAPQVVHFEMDSPKKTFSLVKQVALNLSSQIPISGLPNNSDMEIPVDIFGKPLSFDENGMDPEAICLDQLGQIWIAEEYGPSICRFDSSGQKLDCLKPASGLPAVYSTRKHNRGFEGLACKGDKVYAFLQSPLPGDGLQSRIAEIDIKTSQLTGEFFYPFESKHSDKIGDATVLPDGRIAVLERDGKFGPQAFKRLYTIDLKPGNPMANKTLFRDLSKDGVDAEKLEGVTVVENEFVAVMVDNDFGVAGDPDPRTAVFPESGVKSSVFLIELVQPNAPISN